MSTNSINYPEQMKRVKSSAISECCVQLKVFWANCEHCAADTYEHKCDEFLAEERCERDDNTQWAKVLVGS